MLPAVSRPENEVTPLSSVVACRCLRLSPLAIELMRTPRVTISFGTGWSSASCSSTAIDPAELQTVAADLQRQPGVRHATWEVSTKD